jgi:hypothetical protein
VTEARYDYRATEMLTYALVVASAGRRIPPSVVSRLRDPAERAVPFVARRHVTWSDESETVWFGGWQSTGEDDPIGGRWHCEDGTLTAFTGHAWPRVGPWRGDRPWAAQLAEHLRSSPLPQATDGLLGVFTALSIDARGCGVIAGDALGLSLVFRAHHPDFTVLSSRASLAAVALAAGGGDPRPRRDLETMGFLAYAGRSMTLGTGYSDVEVLPVGATILIDPRRGTSVERGNGRPWRFASRARLRPDDWVDELRADIVTSLRSALSVPVPHHVLNVTGGKDSRMILAAIVDQGLTADFEYQTWGSDDLPDVVVARQIADELGLAHAVNVRAPAEVQWRAERDTALAATGHLEHGEREAMIKLTVGSHLGVLNAIDPQVSSPPHGDRVVLSGLTGELLRANYPPALRLRSLAEIERFLFSGLRFGAAGLLRPEVRSHYDDVLWGMVFDDFSPSDPPQDVVQGFFLRQWLRHWFAAGQEVDELNRVFPLYSPFGARAAFELGPSVRHAEWLHHEVIRAASPRLAELPFAKSGWPAAARPTSPRRARLRPRARVPSRGPTRAPAPFGASTPAVTDRTAKRDLRAANEHADLDLMRRFLVEEGASPLQELLDPKAVALAVERFDELNGRAKLQLYGALTAAIWLADEELTYHPGAPGASPLVGPAP